MLDKLINATHILPQAVKEEPIDCKMDVQQEGEIAEFKPDVLLRLKNEGPPRIPPHAAETPPTDRTPPAAHCNALTEHAQYFKKEAESEEVHDYTTTVRATPPPEPADLSNKKPENVTCVPEIECFRDEINDVASEYSNSSDPDRLEVDMSQGGEEHSNSTTTSATSPVPDVPQEEEGALWRALSQNGHLPSAPLSGEASQLLRKLITCRKLGMSITPAPPTRPPPTYAESVAEVSKTPGRRKQSFPTKAPPADDVVKHEGASPVREMEGDQEYVPDFTGNSPWCNLQIVKTKVCK